MEDVMTSTARTISRQWEATTNLTGVTSASLLVVLVVSTAIGALVGLAVGGSLEPLPLAVIAGFLGTVAAGIVRNTLLIDAWGAAGVEDAGTPMVVITYAAVASLAGSLAADRIALLIGAMPAIVTGGFAGLLSAVLLGLLMVTYRMNPDRPGDRW
jgi:hypothetical protein